MYTQNFGSPGKNSPPIDMIPATTESGTKNVPSSVSHLTDFACMLLACASLNATTSFKVINIDSKGPHVRLYILSVYG
ncbi:hypothetical protein SNOG_15820 [Parastagonospora nodorum SN15]|uniref:Uncharacterized protein n=1 Tax=Phaeosphaeria nodorum (strain SN15 / ATCC MYA-4574 / FGSC 10173) TaxID=321614 RepID=Q0TXQ9_PHANO|nr:hypothetical protein SNOG_15820 [Parastagonospora nodorum SN15]EAT76915.1 hypothetical protein SNOG_15820 [Parastagonospora nodorum SN15]